MKDISDKKRRKEYLKDNSSDDVLKRMNSELLELEKMLISKFDAPNLPIIFVVGVQRSGSTLLLQLLINKYKFLWPNNLMARFWQAPYIGANVYKSLMKNFEQVKISYNSDLGYTKNVTGPHEWGYFWRRWFPYDIYEHKASQKTTDDTLFIQSMAAIESIYNLPIISKNIITCSFYIETLASLLPTSLFINVTRKPIYNVQSTLESRIKLYGNEKLWFGVKPPDYKNIVNLPVPDQIAEQLFSTRQHIAKSFTKLSKDRYLNIKYEDMITEPAKILNKIGSFIKKTGYNLLSKNHNIPILKTKNNCRMTIDKFELYKNSVEQATMKYK